MKRTLCLITALLLIIGLLSSCAGNASGGDATDAGNGSGSAAGAATAAPAGTGDATEEFSIFTSDGKYETEDGVCRITSGGTYSLSGYFPGQIVVEADDGGDVVLELYGLTVSCSTDSPIKIMSAGDVDISAKDGTENVVNDTRSAKTSDSDDLGEGAIYAKTDLKLKGTGTLVINAGYNNGIHTTKDLKIQKLSLYSYALNNAIRAGDSIEIVSGNVVAVSTEGDGIKTVNTDADKSGATRGDVSILGGTVAVYAAGDGIQAAHSFVLASTDGEAAPSLSICTGSYSGYTSSSAHVSSYKGIKVQNELTVSAGLLTVQAYDDGLHADIGTVFEDGTKGLGAVIISGGSIEISVYSPENKTFGGRQGPGGRQGTQQATVSGADGIHADGTLSVSGGTVAIDSAYEGLEANVIEISGGSTKVAANDDGINACKGASTPLVSVSGGFLDVSVPANGDTDGIDSNGSYRQTGGIVITRGPNSEMAAALDADGTVTVTGGTLIILGYGRVSASGSVSSYSLSLHSAGSHTVTVGNATYTFENASAYGRTVCYSDVKVSS